MSKKTITVTGTGDSLFVAKFPKEYDEGLSKVAEFIHSCDARLTNLETNLSDFEYFGNQYSGGTWLNTRSNYVEELFRYGFNYFGNANNHCMDYSYNGLLSTIKVLEGYGKAHSGTGDCLEAAAAPAILDCDGGKVAVFAVDASFKPPSMAGQATRFLKARPGVNYLRHETAYKISEQEMAFLKELCKKTKINFDRDFSIATGYKNPDPEGVFYVGKNQYTTSQDGPVTKCNGKDLERIASSIRKARETCDLAFVLVHCHDDDGVRVENPPEYLKEFAHACIDAGAGAIFGGGCHRLRGMEMYKGFPIFYSLGDFIYQGPKVEFLPAEFMESYKVDINSTAEEALWARSRGNKVGLHCNKKNYQTFLPKLEFEDGRLTAMSMLPIDLNFERKDDMNGLPVVASEGDAAEILALMNELSKPFGVTLKMEDGLMKLA